MSEYDDPNAPTRNQTLLKRAEVALRRRCDVDIFLTLDRISMMKDTAEIRSSMAGLQKALEKQPNTGSNQDV